MDQLHKQILRKNRTILIDNIAKPDDVSDLLYERQVFTESMKQDVEAKNTSIEKTRHILDLIPRRGPRAFDALVAVLRDTGNDHASAILQGGQTGSQSTGAGQEGVVGNAVPSLSSQLPNEMDPHHEQILRNNRTVLIKNIANPDDVNDLLYERQVFTESMKQNVEAKNTSIEKTRHILDLIPRRGPRAFDALVAVLRDTGNDAASATLQGGQTGSQSTGAGQEGVVGYAVPTRRSELPNEWPSEQAMSQLHSDLARYKWLGEDFYFLLRQL